MLSTKNIHIFVYIISLSKLQIYLLQTIIKSRKNCNIKLLLSGTEFDSFNMPAESGSLSG